MPDIKAIQVELRASVIDGWLFYDHHHRDPIAGRVLGLDENGMVTRRWFYFIPSRGEPRGLVHKIEAQTLADLPGEHMLYAGWKELVDSLRRMMQSAHRVAMQYSPDCAVPYVAMVDAGTVELVRGLGVNVVSAANLIQLFEARWTARQLEAHLEAGRLVDRIRAEAFARVSDAVRAASTNGARITEWEVQQFI